MEKGSEASSVTLLSNIALREKEVMFAYPSSGQGYISYAIC